uniref:Uncharacterized protein n=1 Tax=Arundo donax TaxID=35708 RepID=A0A0A9DZX5_ARUDO
MPNLCSSCNPQKKGQLKVAKLIDIQFEKII